MNVGTMDFGNVLPHWALYDIVVIVLALLFVAVVSWLVFRP
jgi:hypothetical protein